MLLASAVFRQAPRLDDRQHRRHEQYDDRGAGVGDELDPEPREFPIIQRCRPYRIGEMPDEGEESGDGDPASGSELVCSVGGVVCAMNVSLRGRPVDELRRLPAVILHESDTPMRSNPRSRRGQVARNWSPNAALLRARTVDPWRPTTRLEGPPDVVPRSCETAGSSGNHSASRRIHMRRARPRSAGLHESDPDQVRDMTEDDLPTKP